MAKSFSMESLNAAQRKAVPVPMVTTTPCSRPDNARAPAALAENSSTLQVGMPKMSPSV